MQREKVRQLNSLTNNWFPSYSGIQLCPLKRQRIILPTHYPRNPDNEYQDTYAYEYTQTGKVSEDAPEGIIAYTNRIEMYTGGAHGGALESYINFNEKTGKIITCDELFGNKQDAVKKLIKEQIIKDNDCKTEEELVEKRSIFSLGDVYISDNNFLIEKDSIMFCYNPYDIAPWSEGFIFAKLSYKELEGLITPNLIKN